MTSHPEKIPSPVVITILLSALMAFTSLSTDVYLPAMPAMTKSLHGDIELTITGFLIGFSIAQLLWGPISDRIGRKKPLVIGMLLFIIGSMGCACSQTIEAIVFWRVFQAIGACTGPMLARAMVRDLYPREHSAHMLSTLFMIMAIAPILGPILGGQILKYSSWHTIFWMLSLFGVVMLLALQLLPESLPSLQRTRAPISHAFQHYVTLLKNASFMRFTFCVTFYYVAAYAFITGSPQVYINYYGIDAQYYGALFAINIVGVIAVSYVNRRLITRYSLEKLLKRASFIGAVSILLLALLVVTHNDNLVTTVICIFFFFSMNGVIAACATTAALDLVPTLAGSGSALIGSLQYGSGILSSILLAALPSQSPSAMTLIMAVFSGASALTALFAQRRSEVKADENQVEKSS